MERQLKDFRFRVRLHPFWLLKIHRMLWPCVISATSATIRARKDECEYSTSLEPLATLHGYAWVNPVLKEPRNLRLHADY